MNKKDIINIIVARIKAHIKLKSLSWLIVDDHESMIDDLSETYCLLDSSEIMAVVDVCGSYCPIIWNTPANRIAIITDNRDLHLAYLDAISDLPDCIPPTSKLDISKLLTIKPDGNLTAMDFLCLMALRDVFGNPDQSLYEIMELTKYEFTSAAYLHNEGVVYLKATAVDGDKIALSLKGRDGNSQFTFTCGGSTLCVDNVKLTRNMVSFLS